VLINQPPFLAQANIEVWLDLLKTLMVNPYRNYIIVSSRGGLVAIEQVREQIKELEKIQRLLDTQEKKKPGSENIDHIVQLLMKGTDYPNKRSGLYQRRLKWGLQQYIQAYRNKA